MKVDQSPQCDKGVNLQRQKATRTADLGHWGKSIDEEGNRGKTNSLLRGEVRICARTGTTVGGWAGAVMTSRDMVPISD